jgi:hypothetical protein
MKSMNRFNCLKGVRSFRYFNIKGLVLTVLLPISLTSCSYSQNKGKQTAEEGNKPKINIKVNKQYDDKGNVIGYDSTYSYSYSDSLNKLKHDTSIFHSFGFPHGQFPGNFNNQFNPDSLLKNDPFFNGSGFNNDPFSNFNSNPFDRMNDMMKQMEEMQKQMQQNMMPHMPFHNQPLIPAPQQQKPERNKSPILKPKPIPPDTTGSKVI